MNNEFDNDNSGDENLLKSDLEIDFMLSPWY